ncbi:MAG: hypothetical protein P9M07_02590, partial [Candidatus Aceula meridiana]|nr:hypothetical protein [Candidatus Aceula meridiana]
MPKNQNIYIVQDVYIPHFGEDAVLKGVEIGVAGASGSFFMLHSMPNLTVYSIDPWKYIENAPFEAGL